VYRVSSSGIERAGASIILHRATAAIS